MNRRRSMTLCTFPPYRHGVPAQLQACAGAPRPKEVRAVWGRMHGAADGRTLLGRHVQAKPRACTQHYCVLCRVCGAAPLTFPDCCPQPQPAGGPRLDGQGVRLWSQPGQDEHLPHGQEPGRVSGRRGQTSMRHLLFRRGVGGCRTFANPQTCRPHVFVACPRNTDIACENCVTDTFNGRSRYPSVILAPTCRCAPGRPRGWRRRSCATSAAMRRAT